MPTYKRFEWAWLHRRQFIQDLEVIHHGRQHILDIPLTATEVAQLKLSGHLTT